MPKFLIANHYTIEASDFAGGFLVNPQFPAQFFDTPNSQRPYEHMLFWCWPFIDSKGEGAGFDVWCLDGGAWDRPTWHGNTATLEQAVLLARTVHEKSRGARPQQLSTMEGGRIAISEPVDAMGAL